MTDNKLNALIAQRARSLQEKRRTLLNQPHDKALEMILDAEKPVELVHSFPEDDLYLLVCDIGAADALPLISLASTKQWEYMLDMEIWEGDRLNPHATTKWFDLLLAADPERLTRWCTDQKKELTELFFQRNIEVRIREEKQDPSDFGDEFFTFDDLFYIRVLAPPGETADGDALSDERSREFQKQRSLFFQSLLKRFAADDFQVFPNLLMESASIIPAETEEECYRLRNVRLAEKGFLPLEEAIGVYQPINPRDMRHRSAKHTETPAPDTPMPPAPLATASMLEKNSQFGKALAAVDQPRLQMLLQSEFAGLCNSIVIADRATIHKRKDLGGIVKKTCGYISIGLEHLSGKDKDLIRTYPLSDLFRVGYGQAMALKWRAEKWQKNSWHSQAGLRLNFWDEVFMGVVGGLLIHRPLFFDNYATGVIYREFFGGDDIRHTRASLDAVVWLDKLFSRLEIDSIPDENRSTLTYKNLLLTLWAAHCLGLPGQPHTAAAIPLKDFQPFFFGLWDRRSTPAVIKDEMKASFRDWIISAGQLDENEFSDKFGRTFTSLFSEIEDEYAQVSVRDLDPRSIHLFRVRD